MSVTDQKLKYCLDCAHAVWPPTSLGECHAPEIPDGTLIMKARDTGGDCGLTGKLFEHKPRVQTNAA